MVRVHSVFFIYLNWFAGELGQKVGGAGGAAHGPRLFGQRITLQADSLALPPLASQLVGTKDFASPQIRSSAPSPAGLSILSRSAPSLKKQTLPQLLIRRKLSDTHPYLSIRPDHMQSSKHQPLYRNLLENPLLPLRKSRFRSHALQGASKPYPILCWQQSPYLWTEFQTQGPTSVANQFFDGNLCAMKDSM